jgi:replicative DNA helicase
MIVVAARPGMGKTNFALNCSNAAVRQGKTVLFFSLEMSKEQLYSRMASAAKGINLDTILSADFAEMGAGVTAFTAEFKDLPFFINDRANHTMASIRNECKKLRRKHGLDLVVIDYLGLIEGEGKSTYEKVSDISRKVKLLAKEMQCPVMILAQLNREVDKRADKIPVMADLRDSGAIEQDADVILFPYRPDAYEHDVSKHTNEASLIVGKLRHGETGQVPVVADFAKARFLPAVHQNYDWMTKKAKRQDDDL